MGQLRDPLPDTTTPTIQSHPNITILPTTAQATIPAYVASHEKNIVIISGPKLAEALAVYYKAGIRRVEAAVSFDGQLLWVDCTIVVRRDRQRNRVYLRLYPLQPAQSLLRDLYRRYRGDAPRRARRPMPVLVFVIKPK
ncbi:MAG: hypothetical protein ACO2PN_12855 [Pyrobaculum sp.]